MAPSLEMPLMSFGAAEETISTQHINKVFHVAGRRVAFRWSPLDRFRRTTVYHRFSPQTMRASD